MRGEQARAVREALVELQEVSGDARALRRGALQAIRKAAEADVATFYDVAPANGGSRVVVWDSIGPDWVVRHLDRVYAAPTPIPQDYSRPRPQWTRAFLNLESILGPRRAPALERFVEREIYGHGLRDQLRLLAYDRDRFVGWIGAFRAGGQPVFARLDGLRVAPLVAPIRSVLAVAARRHDASSDESAADIIVGSDGRVRMASAGARAWLASPGIRDELRRGARTWRGEIGTVAIGGVPAHVVKLEAKGVHGYLVHLPPVARVRRGSSLSPAQLRIAEMAAAGATVPEIARSIGRSIETVRSHMKAVYERLEVGSRVELARALADHRESAGGKPTDADRPED